MKTKKKIVRKFKPLSSGETIRLSCGVTLPIINANEGAVSVDVKYLCIENGTTFELPISPRAIPSLELLLKRAKATFKKR